jgi:hypothetical protein
MHRRTAAGGGLFIDRPPVGQRARDVNQPRRSRRRAPWAIYANGNNRPEVRAHVLALLEEVIGRSATDLPPMRPVTSKRLAAMSCSRTRHQHPDFDGNRAGISSALREGIGSLIRDSRLFVARPTFQDILIRASDAALLERPIIVASAACRFRVPEKLAEIGIAADALSDPVGCNEMPRKARRRSRIPAKRNASTDWALSGDQVKPFRCKGTMIVPHTGSSFEARASRQRVRFAGTDRVQISHRGKHDIIRIEHDCRRSRRRCGGGQQEFHSVIRNERVLGCGLAVRVPE